MTTSLRQTVLLISLALMVALAYAAPSPACTRTTCPPGPVVASFTSTDCSGSAAFRTYGASNMGICQENEGGSVIYGETAEYLTHTVVNNPTCDRTLTNATYFVQQFWYGKCRPHIDQGRDDLGATSSWLVLANVNATYTSPQPPPNVIMTYPDSLTDIQGRVCDQPGNNCTSRGEVAALSDTTHSQDCTPIFSSGLFNASYDGTCYRVGDLYYTSSNCLGDHAYVTRLYTGEGCQNIINAEYRRKVCSPNTSNTLSITCSANPISFPPFPEPTAPSAPSATPTSAASSLSPSFILLLALAIVLI